jgi:hypothetical protein
MTEGQRIVLLIFLTVGAASSIALRQYLYGTFNMGDRVGTLGLMAIIFAFMFGGLLVGVYPELKVLFP